MFAQRLHRALPSRGQGLQLPHYSPGIVQNLARESQQLPVFPLTLSLLNVPHSIPNGDHPPGYAAHAVANTAVVSTRIFRAGIAPAAVPGPRSDHESVVRLIILSMGSMFDFRLDQGGKV